MLQVVKELVRFYTSMSRNSNFGSENISKLPPLTGWETLVAEMKIEENSYGQFYRQYTKDLTGLLLKVIKIIIWKIKQILLYYVN